MQWNRLFRSIFLFAGIALGVMFAADRAYAQTAQDRCVAVTEELKSAIAQCDDINSNWACYASVEADVVPIQYRFQGLRDRRPLEVVENLNTDADGVVIMNMHLVGETNPIKTMLFGDGTLDPVEPGKHSFIMTIDDPTNLCDQTPPGLILHTEDGTSGQIELNGVTIELKSTAFVTIESDGLMTIVNLEGDVTVTIGGVTQALPVGFQTRATITGTPGFALQQPASSLYNSSIPLREVTDNLSEGIKRVRNSNEDDALACVQDIDLGAALTNQAITHPGHECLYRFCIQGGESFSIEMEAADGQLDAWVDLRGPDGNLIAFNNDVNSSTNSAICNEPLTQTGCYTVVARSRANETLGSFNISVNQGSTCIEPPLPACLVTAGLLNLREGPGTTFDPIGTLSRNTTPQLLGFSPNQEWAQFQVGEQRGYSRNLPQYLQCEIQSVDKVPTIPLPVVQPPVVQPPVVQPPVVQPPVVQPPVVQPPVQPPSAGCDTARGLNVPGCTSLPTGGPENPVVTEENPVPVAPKTGPFGGP